MSHWGIQDAGHGASFPGRDETQGPVFANTGGAASGDLRATSPSGLFARASGNSGHWALPRRRDALLLIALGALVLLTIAWSLYRVIPVVALVLVFVSVPFAFWIGARFNSAASIGIFAFATTLAGAAIYVDRDLIVSHGPLGVSAPWLWLASLCLPALVFAIVAVRHQRALTSLSENHDRMRQLAGRLIQAREIESSRIAREVHDDINQQLASLSIGLSALRRRVGASHGSEVEVLQERLHSIIDDVRRISRNLHPSVLRHVGLPAALSALCQYEAEQRKLALTFEADLQMAALSEDVSLCLYRVVQEALRNIVQHAAATAVRVTLERHAKWVGLLIEDDGRGFDTELKEIVSRTGIGLSCMEERVRILYGALDIRSSPGQGCSIRARIPLAP